MKILIIGYGHVGKAVKSSLTKNNTINTFDTDRRKCKERNTIKHAIVNNDLFFICLPTDLMMGQLDCHLIEEYLDRIQRLKPKSIVIIKSTLNMGFMNSVIDKFKKLKLFYIPEFIREGKEITDALYPDRIVIGYDGSKKSKALITNFLSENHLAYDSCPTLLMSYSEAELVKLASNAYLASRVAFFNEVDSICLNRNLNSPAVIKAISMDKRIGDYYNNPSFGYGGYCLPKDVSSLTSGTDRRLPLINSINNSNQNRLDIIEQYINTLDEIKTIGIYKINSKEGSTNIEQSAALFLATRLSVKYRIIIYGTKNRSICSRFEVMDSLKDFKKKADLILANRYEDVLKNITHKLFCPDIRQRN